MGSIGKQWPNALDLLAAAGFLLVDSLPFALPYSDWRLRDRNAYSTMVAACRKSFLDNHLQRVPRWATTVTVALAYRVNAGCVIAACDGALTLPTGLAIRLSEALVVAEGAGHPVVRRIQEVFGLP